MKCIRYSILILQLFCGLSLLLCKPAPVFGQDSLRVNPDSITVKDSVIEKVSTKRPAFLPSLDSLHRKHSPRRAVFYSAVLPGLGQAYNHQYIKIPLMYGGLGVATGIFIFNFNHYITYRDAYRLRLNGRITHDPRVDVYSLDNLSYLRDGYRQYVDYSVLGFLAVYLYNVLDALVFAHLYNFDVSNDLSKLKFGPVFHQKDPYVGFGFTYTFRK